MVHFIPYNELIERGVSEKYLKVALYRFREHKTESWENYPDPLDGRKVLIKIDTIPERTRQKYNIPDAKLDMQQKLEHQVEGLSC